MTAPCPFGSHRAGGRLPQSAERLDGVEVANAEAAQLLEAQEESRRAADDATARLSELKAREAALSQQSDPAADTRQALARSKGVKGSLPQVFGAAGYPVSGAYIEAIGAVFPKAWDVEETYGWVEGSAATFWSAGSQGRATLALRAGGKHLLGDSYPYFSAATIGGGTVLENK